MSETRDVINQLREVGKANASIAKQVEATSKQLSDVAKAIRRTSALENAALLTKDELEILRNIVIAGQNANDYCQQIVKEDPSLRGTYLALADSGFLNVVETIGQDVYVFGITNRGLWVIEHRDTIDRERENEKHHEAIRFALGVAVEIYAVVLAWWLGVNGPSLVTTP